MFSKIGIIGCGTVGQNLAKMISTNGVDVVFLELSQEKINDALKEIDHDLNGLIESWGLTEGEKRGILSRIKGTLSYEDLADCEIVIDAILSKRREKALDVRKEIFKNLEKFVSPSTIIATNSTTIAITEISNEMQHKERCVSLHFSITAPHAQIVEVVRSFYTSDEAYQRVLMFTKLMRRTPVPVLESPGLISVRLFVALISEACDVLMEGVSNIENIDLTMRSGFNLPLGPFEMADKVGLDRVVQWMENMYNEFGDKKYKTPPLMKRMVRAHQTGRKSGKGFYEYDENGNKIKRNLL
jgi:3-hydroxybutyryl-CoA dehydrogenase